MHDHWLVALSLTVSSAGIIGLLYALLILQPPLEDPAGLVDGAPLRVRGTLIEEQHRGDLTILTLSINTTIDAVLFENATLGLPEGACLDVRGKKGTYDSRPQVVVSRIAGCE